MTDYKVIRTRDPKTQNTIYEVWEGDVMLFQRSGPDCERIAKEVARHLRRGWTKEAAIREALA